MKIEDILKILELYKKYKSTENIKYKEEILLYYVDLRVDVELLEMINNFLLYNLEKFGEMLEFYAFLIGYNLTRKNKIDRMEIIAISAILIDFDDDGLTLIKGYDDFTDYEKFEIYKEKFL